MDEQLNTLNTLNARPRRFGAQFLITVLLILIAAAAGAGTMYVLQIQKPKTENREANRALQLAIIGADSGDKLSERYSDADGDMLTYSVVAGPAHGALSGVAPNLTYTPAANYNGADSFTFKANDGTVDSSAATVSLTITAVNDAPVAADQAVTTAEDTAKAIVLTASDVDGDALTYAIVVGPAHGALSGVAPTVTYTPAANYNGPDSFTFKANDGTVDSAIATVAVKIGRAHV